MQTGQLQETQLLNTEPGQAPGPTYWPMTWPELAKIVDPVTRE